MKGDAEAAVQNSAAGDSMAVMFEPPALDGFKPQRGEYHCQGHGQYRNHSEHTCHHQNTEKTFAGGLLQQYHGVTMLKLPVGLSNSEKKRNRSRVLPSTSS